MSASLDSVDRHLFLEGVFLRYGYDFREYSAASLDRRLSDIMIRFSHNSLYDTLKMVMNSAAEFQKILPLLTISTSEFFRDPLFFKALREQILPVLGTYPRLNFWTAGCSTGEEVVSLAILLKEEGLYDRATIFATDVNPDALKMAKAGIFDVTAVQSFAKGYAESGGKKSPSEYYTADYGLVKFDPALFENVVFQEHNLATDSVFAEHHLILCRNVMIYFSRELQERVFKLFTESLIYRGFLGIGSKESMRFATSSKNFQMAVEGQNIYQIKAQARHE